MLVLASACGRMARGCVTILHSEKLKNRSRSGERGRGILRGIAII